MDAAEVQRLIHRQMICYKRVGVQESQTTIL